MFWTGIGPKTPNSALATSVSHDLHNITVVGSGDAAMALAVNRIAEMQGGIVLVNVNPAYRSHELRYVIEKSRMKVLFLRERDHRGMDILQDLEPGFSKADSFRDVLVQFLCLASGGAVSGKSLLTRAPANGKDHADRLVRREAAG